MPNEFQSGYDYLHFAKEVCRSNRFFPDKDGQQFLETVKATAKTCTLETNEVLYRAQPGQGECIEVKGIRVLRPHDEKRMMPQIDRAMPGRANVAGIPVFYAAKDPTTAAAEVRSGLASFVSIGKYRAIRPLSLVDCCSNAIPGFGDSQLVMSLFEQDSSKFERYVWHTIDLAFAEPVSRDDELSEYAPTQMLCELFRKAGYDGIQYGSAMNLGGINIALFRPDTVASANDCCLYRVKRIAIEIEPFDEPEGIFEVNGLGPFFD